MTGYAGLEGPYPLSYEGISEALPVKTAGVFALGYVGRDNAFYINYIPGGILAGVRVVPSVQAEREQSSSRQVA
jgi:hypothetical protein